MREITENELKLILEKHLDWLNNKKGGERANLRYVNLIGANLSNANLIGADLSYADLNGTDLRWANLRGANLTGADLCNADLSYANLRNVNLSDANLSDANLSNVIVNETTAFYHLQCPEKGSFTGFKKCKAVTGNQEYVIAELLIPKDAKRSSATSRKCRCDRAKVVAFYDLEGNKLNDLRRARSLFGYSFTYELDKTVEVNNFDENRWTECSEGIHFFMSFKEAVNYNLN